MDEMAYQEALGDALEQLLSSGCDDLSSLAEGLNRLQLAPAGDLPAWDAASLGAELARLGQ